VIHVSEEQTLLEALEDAGLEPPSMCRGGVCGACETGVVAGAVEHRDHVLTPEQKARTRTMMVCVSRAACKGVVIDL
jgi:ferredoxin